MAPVSRRLVRSRPPAVSDGRRSVSIEVAAKPSTRLESLRRGDLVSLECRDTRDHKIVSINGDSGGAPKRRRFGRAAVALVSALIALFEAGR